MTLIEKTGKKMEELISSFLFSWNGWFLPLILKEFNLTMCSGMKIFLGATTLFFSVYWMITLYRLSRLTKEIESNELLKSAFQDDYMISAKQKSYFWGFVTAISAAAVMAVCSSFFKINGVLASLFIILAAVNGAVLSYLIVLKKGDSNE